MAPLPPGGPPACGRATAAGAALVAAGLEVAESCRPAARSFLGSDWSVTVALPGGRAVVVVGDVLSHGPAASRRLAQLRAGAAVAAEMDLPADLLLRRLSHSAASGTRGALATCACAMVDGPHRQAVIGSAGHPPPVVARPGGGTDVLWRSVGLPLGFPGQGACAGVKVGLPAGSTLALYSDGLVQTPSRTLDEGIAELQRALAVTAALPIRAACDTIASRLAVGGRDDATLVLVRVPGRERLGTPLRPAAHG